ncbi:MAG: Metalloprotease LoiP precursor [Syntrophorhabdaceae bacterium PtaU1.Bin034]|nr:MAG: Metalloprotease LoiP precursor [Syntrophorhabdaceae bacterium PtaU1.Bin034]
MVRLLSSLRIQPTARARKAVVVLALSIILLTGCALDTGQRSSGRGGPTTPGRPATTSTTKVDPAQAQRLQQIMAPLIQHMNNPIPLNEVRVGILDSQDINAANAGAGRFYVTIGLLAKANDEHLRGVLAHEIAHEDLGHVAKAQILGTGLQIGTIILDQIIPGSGSITPMIADLGVMKPYSRSEEYAADAHGVEILKRSGYNGKQVMGDTLQWLLQASGPSGGFFTSHPGTEDRIQRIRQMP